MRKPWSEVDVELLKLHFPTTPLLELSILVGHTYSSTYSKCGSLKLKKPIEYRREYLKINRQAAVAAITGKAPWNKKPLVKLCCKWCNQDFEVVHARRNRAVFCKRACMTEWRKTITGAAHWLDTKVERACKWCNSTFRTKKAKVGYGEGHYCSLSCKGSAVSYQLGQQKGPTSIERKMQAALIENNIDFIAQHPIGPWCVDFYLPTLNLVIECDGDYWHSLDEVKIRDKRKNGYLKKAGFKVARITESTINANVNAALSQAILI